MITEHSTAFKINIIESMADKLIKKFLEVSEDAYNENKQLYIFLDFGTLDILVYDQDYDMDAINCYKIYTVKPEHYKSKIKNFIAKTELERLLGELRAIKYKEPSYSEKLKNTDEQKYMEAEGKYFEDLNNYLESEGRL